MSDDETTTQEDTPQDSPVMGTPPASETPVSDTPDVGKLQSELDEIRAALKKANAEAADRRKKLDAFEKAEQERKDAELSERERLEKRLEKAETERTNALMLANDRLLKSAFIAEAAKANAEHPEDAYLLADRTNVSVDDDGAVVGVAEAVKALVESGRLHIRRPTAPNLNGGAGGGQRASEQQATKLAETELAMARRMGITPEQYAKAKKTE